MTDGFADPATITGYHAHIYYDAASRARAEQLREAIGARFTVQLGRMHDAPVGPHPQAMYQVAFAVGELPRMLPWLLLNRGGLNVLVHPMTGNSFADHTDFASWLGTPLPLRTEMLRRVA